MRLKMSRCFRAAKTVLLTMLFIVVIVIVVGCSGEGQKDTIEASFTRKTEEVAKEKVAGVRNTGIGEYAVTLADGRVYTGYIHDIPAKAENLKCLYIKDDHGRVAHCWVYPEYYAERYEAGYKAYADENRVVFYVRGKSNSSRSIAQFETEY